MNAVLKDVLKSIRALQPFNCVATGAVRSVFHATGLQSEKVIKHLHRLGKVQSRLPNGRTLLLWSRGDDWVSNQVFWRGWAGYEPETVPLFFSLATRSQVTLDVGAHVGFFALLAGHANSAGRVFAFEPMPAIHARLKSNIALNGLTNVDCVASAVGETDGEAEFYHVPDPEGLPSSSSLSLGFMSAGGGELTSSKVPVVTLDRFLAERHVGRVDLMKIDTESTEPQVLRGMAKTLARDRPTLICEVLKGRGTEASLEAILGPLGYAYFLLTPDGPIAKEHIEGHPEWLNYLFSTAPLAPAETRLAQANVRK